MNKAEPLSEEARAEIEAARARVRQLDEVASAAEKVAHDARAAFYAARTSLEVLLDQHAGQLSLLDEEGS